MEKPALKSSANESNEAEAAPNSESPSKLENKRRGRIRAFVDFLVLFSGISTASNLARTQGRALLTRGVFLFRRK